MDFSHFTLLDLFLIILVVAAIFALVALGMLLLKLGKSVGELSSRVAEMLDELKPTREHINAVSAKLPAIADEVSPLMKKTGTAIDAVSLDLLRLEGILGDVSHATGAMNRVSNSASRAANSVSSTIVGAANSIKDRLGFGKKAKASEKNQKSTDSQKGEAQKQDFVSVSGSEQAATKLTHSASSTSESAEYYSYTPGAHAKKTSSLPEL